MFSPRIRKAIAVFLLITIINSAIGPAIGYALTSGPTTPETTSFEPVDTSTMVNLATGDLVYNIPLLEVPGPSGGYPISLSYHAGIMPNEEASWSGLGWTINPGAISRTVNGFADDHVTATKTRIDHNSGAERNTFTVGVGLPGAGFNLAVSHDSNLGTAIGSSMSAGGQIGNLDVGVQVGVQPFGGTTASAGVGFKGARVGIDIDQGGGVSASVGATAKVAKGLGQLGIETNFKSIGITAQSGSRYSMGMDISSKGVRSSHSVAGARFDQINSRAGNWNISSFGVLVPVPLGTSGVFLNLGYNYLRYYSHESSDMKVIGSLHANKTSGKNPDDWAFDSYALVDPDLIQASIKNSDPEKARGGSFPAYDSYQVNAQGLSGSMQPYIFDNGTLFRQNLKNKDGDKYIIQYKSPNSSSNDFNFRRPVNFRFKGDFSNTYSYSKNEMTVTGEKANFNNSLIDYKKEEGFNSPTQHLAGSKHTEWFTNRQIAEGSAKQSGFCDYQTHTLRSQVLYGKDISNQIGGFKITNESGVTYHYALPAYAYNEFSKSFLKDKPNKIYQTNSNPHPYAYTWLLTAVTGSDYVDRNLNGIADLDDWGYWVSFEYGLWADNYKWRNPAEGFHTDLDADVAFYSRGEKQLYYLDAIKTQSHVAIFEKETRHDSKGMTKYDLEPSFQPYTSGSSSNPCHHLPTETLRLKNIYLLNRGDFSSLGENTLKSNTDQDQHCKPPAIECEAGGKVFRCNTFEENDNYLTILGKSIRVINFRHDYSLQPETTNSFSLSSPVEKDGKLTLTALKFLGKGGADLLPPVSFLYDQNKNFPYDKDAYDNWGFYKHDYKEGINERLNRTVTKASARSVDAWSLTTIRTSVGSDINITYESDSYTDAVLAKQIIFDIKDVEHIIHGGNNRLKLTFHETEEDNELDLKDFYINENILSVYVVGFHTRSNGKLFLGETECSGFQNSFLNQAFNFESDNALIKEVGKDYLIVDDPGLYAQLIAEKSESVWDFEDVEDGRRYVIGTCPGREGSYNYFNAKVKFTGYPDLIAGGCISISNNGAVPFEGGGLRVKELLVTSSFGNRVTKYSYEKGTTAYEPFGIIKPVLKEDTIKAAEWQEAFDGYGTFLNKKYSKLLNISREIPAPGVIYQTVTVEEEIRYADRAQPEKIPGKKVYRFDVFEDKMIERTAMQKIGEETPPNPCADDNAPCICYDDFGNQITCQPPQTTTTHTPVSLNDFSLWAGALRSVSTYGTTGNLLEEIENHYLHDGLSQTAYQQQLEEKYHSQGVISQVFNEFRVATHNFGETFYHVFSKRTEYPLISVSQTVTNHTTGIKSSTENLAFDFYTGDPIKTVSHDSYGNSWLTESVSAYTVPEYSGMSNDQIQQKFTGMGIPVKNPKNKNMLTQNAATYIYKLNSSDEMLGLLSAATQTWSDKIVLAENESQLGVWRKQSLFSWNGQQELNKDGTYPIGDYRNNLFKWSMSDNASWEKINEVSLYDRYSHTLQSEDINGTYASTRLNPQATVITASAVNSKFDEMAFSGSEYYEGNLLADGGVDRGEGNATKTRAHTGDFSLLVGYNSEGFSYILDNKKANVTKKYRASVWVYVPGEAETQSQLDRVQLYYSIGNTEEEVHPLIQKKKSKSWYLLEIDIDPGTSNSGNIYVGVRNNSSRGTYFDDFRVHPLDCAMSSFIYDQLSNELTYVLGTNNFYTRYEYDKVGRLIRVSRELLNFDFGDGKESFKADKVISETTYNLKAQ
jgi:hypothetical protein